MGITLSHKYKPLWDDDYTYAIVTGGRGSSKSFSVQDFIENLTFERGHKILISRYTLVSAHSSIIPEFTEKIELEGHGLLFDITKYSIKNIVTDSEILFKGIKTGSGSQTANLKSLQGITTWVLDEAEELTDEATFDKIDDSIRTSGKRNRVILVLNPTTKEHFIYKRFFESVGIKEGFNGIVNNVLYIHTTYLDNLENLSQKFLAKVNEAKTKRPQYYKHSILGAWLDRLEGAVFERWSYGKFDETLNIYYGMDFGFSIDPDTLIKVAIDQKRKKIYAKELLYKNGLTTDELAKIIINFVGNEKVICDSAEPRLIYELKTKTKKNNIVAVVKPKIKTSIKLVQDYEIIVEENSLNLSKELNNYCYTDKINSIPVDAYNHLLDPLRYVVMTILNSNGSTKATAI